MLWKLERKRSKWQRQEQSNLFKIVKITREEPELSCCSLRVPVPLGGLGCCSPGVEMLFFACWHSPAASHRVWLGAGAWFLRASVQSASHERRAKQYSEFPELQVLLGLQQHPVWIGRKWVKRV